jgi:N-acetylated-alpha-linked acidic dipeptidase
VVGEDYEPAIMVTRMASAVASRVASAALVPLQLSRYPAEVHRHLVDLTKRGIEAGMFTKSDTEVAPELLQVDAVAKELTGKLEAMEEILLQAATSGEKNLSSASKAIFHAERGWLNEEGIPGRPWFKSLYAASDEDSGYAAWPVPALRWCIEHKDAEELKRQAEQYRTILGKLAGSMSEAIATISSPDIR